MRNSRERPTNAAAQLIRLLLIEDNPGDVRLIAELLKDAAAHFEMRVATSIGEAVRKATGGTFDVILLDLGLPDSEGLDSISRMQAVAAKAPIVVLTGADDEAQAMDALRQGAQDYLIKGQVDARLLVRAIRYAIERKREQEQLKALNETLEQRVAERTAVAERRARQLRALAIELTRAEQRERRRLAELLHDHLQQVLVAAKYGVGSLRRGGKEIDIARAIANLEGLLDEAIKASRSLTSELSPMVVYEGNLAAALEWLGRWMDERHGLRVHVTADPDLAPVDLNIRLLMFSAVRELLLNVVKHARVSKAKVHLYRPKPHMTAVTVSDTGVGFDKQAAGLSESQGFGLFSIRERFENVGGCFEIETAADQGTRVTLMAPDSAAEPSRTRAVPGSRRKPPVQ